MGTCYYLHPKENPGDLFEPVHIGKSSHGWCFSLHVIPEKGINDLEDWKPLLKRGLIKNEYYEEFSYEEMLSVITDRSFPDTPEECEKKLKESSAWYSSYEDFLEKNQAIRGPNNLLRHRIDGHHCIRNGNGTWDCIVGEFS